MRKRHFTWEDAVLLVATSAWLFTRAGMEYFHVYAIIPMTLSLSLGFRKGVYAALIRAIAASVVIVAVGAVQGEVLRTAWMESFSVLACGIFAGYLGGRQRKANDALKKSFEQTLDVLAGSLEARDPYTEGHSRRTAQYATAIAKAMGLDSQSQIVIDQAARLHDLGKIGTPDAILRKQGTLTSDEKRQMDQHPNVAGHILKNVPFLEPASQFVLHHHEHYDGSGYPDGLKGASIPLGARILAVADSLDALTSDRPYHKAIGREEAIKKLQEEEGRQFDPSVLVALTTANLNP